MSSRKILIVDDEDSVRLLLKLQVTSIKYDLVEARNGIEGLTMAKMTKPDLIITDLMMPGMSGLELIAELKTFEETKYIPVVVVTGGGIELQREALDAGAVAVLSKPIHKKDLVAIIQSVFQTVAS